MRNGFLSTVVVVLGSAGSGLAPQCTAQQYAPTPGWVVASAAQPGMAMNQPLGYPQPGPYLTPAPLPAMRVTTANVQWRPLDNAGSVDQALNDSLHKVQRAHAAGRPDAQAGKIVRTQGTAPAKPSDPAAPQAAQPKKPATEAQKTLPPLESTANCSGCADGGACDGGNAGRSSVDAANDVEDTSGVDVGLEGHCAGNRFWVNAEALVWWIKTTQLSAVLVNTGPAISQGLTGQPGVNPAFAGPLSYGTAGGGKLTLGMFLDPCQSVGLEVSGFLLETKTTNYSATSDGTGNPLLVSPFFNTFSNSQGASFIALPNQNSGVVNIRSTMAVWGLEADLTHGGYRSDVVSADWIYGFRYFDMNNDIFDDRTPVLLPGITVPFNRGTVTAPATFILSDRFQAHNEFYGGQVGYRREWGLGRAILGLTGKLGIGATHEILDVEGSTTVIRPTGTIVVPGGVYALASNIGRQSKNRFALLPEAEFRLGYHFTDRIVGSLAYNFLYLSDVIRPGDNIPNALNTGLLPTSRNFGNANGTLAPVPSFKESDFWVQGLSLGLAFAF